MDIKELLANTKDTISNLTKPLVEKVREFYEENKMLSLIIAALTALLLLCILLLVVIAGKKKNTELFQDQSRT